MKTACVITSINHPTTAVREWETFFHERLYVIGDRKTPADWKCGLARFISIEDQAKRNLASIATTPENHYARKNIGYLMAMSRPDTDCIFETDDDNRPSGDWTRRKQGCDADIVSKRGWCNVYGYFSGKDIWPRGLPLTKLNLSHGIDCVVDEKGVGVDCPIHQGLANGNPDVDAIWRLVMPQDVSFFVRRSIALGSGVWCPFNSQSTWWLPDAFPLMYLPIHATFRMTDIWRSFIAQRCLWAMNKSVVYHSPAEVIQDRNEHDLLSDFQSEIAGYLNNEKIASDLDKTTLKTGLEAVPENLRTCYEMVVDNGFLPKDELRSVDAWLEDVKRMTAKASYREKY